MLRPASPSCMCHAQLDCGRTRAGPAADPDHSHCLSEITLQIGERSTPAARPCRRCESAPSISGRPALNSAPSQKRRPLGAWQAHAMRLRLGQQGAPPPPPAPPLPPISRALSGLPHIPALRCSLPFNFPHVGVTQAAPPLPASVAAEGWTLDHNRVQAGGGTPRPAALPLEPRCRARRGSRLGSLSTALPL